MKRIFVFAIAATSFVACNDQKTTDTTTVNSDTTTMVTMDDNTMATQTYVASEGDVMYRDGKVMVWRNNAYVEADNDVTLDDNIVVKRNGDVIRNGETARMEDGEAVTRTGRWFNKAGEGIEDGWEATKKGVRKAGEAIKKGAKKVGEEVKDVVN